MEKRSTQTCPERIPHSEPVAKKESAKEAVVELERSRRDAEGAVSGAEQRKSLKKVITGPDVAERPRK
jgi:hypothetical protein